MNKKQFTILLVLLLVVGGLGLYFQNQKTAGWGGSGGGAGKKVLADFNINDVSHILIRQGSSEVNLRKKGEIWTVAEREDYPAGFSQISDFIIKTHDLKAAQSMAVGPSQRSRLEVQEPGAAGGSKTGTLVEFRGPDDKPIRHFVLGKSHMRSGGEASQFGEGGWPDGRYILPSPDSDHVDVVADPLSVAEAKPEQWLDKEFFKIEKPKSISLESPVATNSWKVYRESEAGEWKLDSAKPGEQLDSSKTGSLSSGLANPSISDVVTNAATVSSNLAAGLRLTLQTFDNFTYHLTVATNSSDSYYLTVKVAAEFPKARVPGQNEKAEDKTRLDKEFADNLKKSEDKLKQERTYENRVFLVSKWTIDSVAKERGQLMVEKKTEKKDDSKAADPSLLPK